MNNSLRDYLPPLFLLSLAWLILAFPMIAAVFVGGLLILVGVSYALLVYRWHKFQKMGGRVYPRYQWEQDIYDSGGPGLRNISVKVFSNYSTGPGRM